MFLLNISIIIHFKSKYENIGIEIKLNIINILIIINIIIEYFFFSLKRLKLITEKKKVICSVNLYTVFWTNI